MEFSSKISSPYRIRTSSFASRCAHSFFYFSEKMYDISSSFESNSSPSNSSRGREMSGYFSRERRKFEERRRKLNYERYLIKRELETNAARSR